MALDQSVCTELLEAFKTSDGVDLIRDAVRYVFQELIESEATAQIGAERYERSEGRVTERNGHRVRLVSTKAGDVELAIPKLRKGPGRTIRNSRRCDLWCNQAANLTSLARDYRS